MKRRQNHLVNISLAVIVASGTILLSETVFFKRIELVTLDTFFRLRFHPPKPPDDIVIIEINNNDIRTIGRWPWERRWMAKMAGALNAFGARDILYDFLFSSVSDLQDDIRLQKSIARAGNVYLPFFLEHSGGGIRETLSPIARLAKGAKGGGFINIIPDIDGSLRRLQLYIRGRDRLYYSVVLRMAMDRLGLAVKAIRPDHLVLANADRELCVPLTDGNALLINWYGPWDKTFRRYSFMEIIRAYEDVSSGRTPVVDVKPLRNSTCIVALTAVGLYDIKAIPLEPEYPGAGLIATALSNILNHDFIRIVPLWLNMLFIYLAAIAASWLISKERPFKEIWGIVSALAILGVTYVLFLRGYKMMLSAPLIALFNSYLVVTAYNFISPDIFYDRIDSHQKDKVRLEEKNRELCEDLRVAMGQKKDLEKINQELDRFVHTVSHDIRSPLLGILGYADLLQQKIQGKLRGEDQKDLEGIFANIDHLDKMIDDLLESTKITRIRNPYEAVDFNALVKMVEKRLEFKIRDSRAEIAVPQELPHIVCDRIKMGEVFHNLVANAVKFSSLNDNRPRIEIRYQDKGDVHEFMVKDNGIGIDPRYHQKIFEMFQCACDPEQGGGTGLGLSIVREIIAGHGGRVWVESREGQGAAFFFTIPKGLNVPPPA